MSGWSPASAGAVQIGDDQVTINSGGGQAIDGSDGIGIVFNGNGTDAAEGSDELRYRATRQYCCGGGGPMLNIGGTLYGPAGPARNYTAGVDLAISALEGTATTEAAAATGAGSAELTYTITHDSLEYEIVRTVSYQYPNSFFLDEYEIIIPTGNTDIVKFYFGGDTAPGSSDSGQGVELTEPARTIYSVNPSSEIQFGYGEVVGGVPFDGAVVGRYSAPYAAVTAGEDIGFAVTTEVHDAGLMMQWTLGSTPGTYDRSMYQLVGARGAVLSARFTDEAPASGLSTDLELQILNTAADPTTSSGFALSLPSGLSVSGSSTSSCGGTLTAPLDGTTVDLTDGVIAAGANCVITVPVTAAGGGAYTVDGSSVTSVTEVENGIGTTTATFVAPVVPDAPDAPATPAPPASPSCTVTLTGAHERDSGVDGIVSRLYMASFKRQPDAAGHAYWVNELTTGTTTIDDAAGFFVSSPEFLGTYGQLDTSQFVDRLYNNVMCRDADAAGQTYWLAEVGKGLTRSGLVQYFSQSPEFRMLTATS